MANHRPGGKKCRCATDLSISVVHIRFVVQGTFAGTSRAEVKRRHREVLTVTGSGQMVTGSDVDVDDGVVAAAQPEFVSTKRAEKFRKNFGSSSDQIFVENPSLVVEELHLDVVAVGSHADDVELW